ncbi:type-F conjugative transfer system pilin assembly protein TraF, partial [Vibrio crassostreae]
MMMKNPLLCVITLTLLAHLPPTLAHETPPGWRWYNEPKARPDKPKPKPLPSNTQTTVSSAKTLS